MNAANDDHRLTTALRDRLDDVHPDLDRLVAVATRQGARIRRRNRLAVWVGSVAGVAAVAAAVAVGSSWTGADPSGAPHRPGIANGPSSSPATSMPSPSAVTTAPRVRSHMAPPIETSPVSLDRPGWSCAPPADEKFTCSNGDHSVLITWRPAADRPSWGGDPDKTADFISDVHGDFFVTVDAIPGTPSSDAVLLAQALTWTKVRPAARSAKISVASSTDWGAGVSSRMDCPTASCAVHPYSRSAALFQ